MRDIEGCAQPVWLINSRCDEANYGVRRALNSFVKTGVRPIFMLLLP